MEISFPKFSRFVFFRTKISRFPTCFHFIFPVPPLIAPVKGNSGFSLDPDSAILSLSKSRNLGQTFDHRMASDPPIHRVQNPIAPAPGVVLPVNYSAESLSPVRIVTDPSQLPPEFLDPSAERQLAIGFDCEGVDLSRNGALCVMQLAFPDAVYLVDVLVGGKTIMQACKPALESSYITKVVHDCKRDSEALYFQFGIKLHNVMDTQIAYALIEEQEGRRKNPNDCVSFVSLLADPRYYGTSYIEKQKVRDTLRKDHKFWTVRPMTELMVRAAAEDVRFLLFIYHKITEKLNDKFLWHLAVRGSLRCKCFCLVDSEYADTQPPLPPLPASLVAEGYAPEEEIVSVLNIPQGGMGRVIGKRGASIKTIKGVCNAEIIIGGDQGPPDTVILIGPLMEVRKGEAIIRGRLWGTDN